MINAFLKKSHKTLCFSLAHINEPSLVSSYSFQTSRATRAVRECIQTFYLPPKENGFKNIDKIMIFSPQLLHGLNNSSFSLCEMFHRRWLLSVLVPRLFQGFVHPLVDRSDSPTCEGHKTNQSIRRKKILFI